MAAALGTVVNGAMISPSDERTAKHQDYVHGYISRACVRKQGVKCAIENCGQKGNMASTMRLDDKG